MYKLRELLRLKYQVQLKHREIARAMNVSASTVSYYLNAAQAAEIKWPADDKLSNSELLVRVEQYAKHLHKSPKTRQKPNWEQVRENLAQKHMTLALLWEEYAKLSPENHYSYAQFTRLYKAWCKRHKVTMRLEHIAGDKSFIDYAGDTLPIYSRKADTVAFHAHIFVMVMGLSDYTFAYANASESLPDWIDAHNRACQFFGGVSRLWVPDNLKSGITDSCQFEPLANQTYADMAKHYGTAIIPARPRRPQDKSKAENGVLVAERSIMARLSQTRFYSLDELNIALSEHLYVMNHKPFQKRQGSRHSQFIEKEKPMLKPLPKAPYMFAQFKYKRVKNDYHLCIEKHDYSVPYTLVGEEVLCRYTQTTVEILYDNKRICSHARSFEIGGRTTDKAHMPEAHLKYANWTPQVFLEWADMSGKSIYQLAQYINANKKHPEQIAKFHFGLKHLVKAYNQTRLNNACARALAMQCVNYRSIESILKNALDKVPHVRLLPSKQQQGTPTHNNLRGAEYYAINTSDKET